MTNLPAGRRSATAPTRRRDVTVILSVLLPLLAGLALLGINAPDPAAPETQAPKLTELTRTVVACPSGEDSGFLAVTAEDAEGSVDVRVGDKDATAELSPHSVTRVSGGDGPLVAKVEGDLARATVAARFNTLSAAAECGPPLFDQWFTAVGAGARHSSVLELVNPDAGQAVVDATVYGKDGIVKAERLHGIAVAGRSVVRVPLAEVAPRRDELALHVVNTRGRVIANVIDSLDELGQGKQTTDYLGTQIDPSTSNLLLGLPQGTGSRTLVIANPGDDQIRAKLEIVTPKSVFAPTNAPEIVVEPQSVKRVPVKQQLSGESTKDAVGVRVTSSAPVTVSLRSFVDGDLSVSVPTTSFGDHTTVIVGPGPKQLLLGAATKSGTVTVVGYDSSGKQVIDKRIEIVASRGFAASIPDQAVLLDVSVKGAEVAGTVMLTRDGVALTRLPLLRQTGLVAHVAPAGP